jgi:hypothetical protein
MRALRRASFWAASALIVAAVGPVQAKEGDPIDPAATAQALGALLAASNAVIPASSSCQGHYGQTGKATVKDLLAVQLAYLYSGNNVIQGNCQSRQCTVTITHAAGEDVSSATITFDKVRGKARISTLQCLMTP